ncbi:MAG: DUF2723 domain-containing protein [Candidatus Promineifilaceae bacterium]|nr:DUF2723 domain-containing protein [Candidatus Promineifilaceae bacterium]
MTDNPYTETNPYGQHQLLLPGSLRYLEKRPSLLVFGITTLFAVFTYLVTIAPDLTWANYSGDAGELITAAVTLGVPHPPGYPTYIMIGKLFSLLPVGTVAFRFNMFSAVSAALAAGFVSATAFEQVRDSRYSRIVAIATGLTFAFAPLVWSQATVTEVYSLRLALAAAFLWSLLGKRSAILTGSLLGLAITAHLTSILLIPMTLFLIETKQRRRLAVGTIIGLTPILAMPFITNQQSPVLWGDISTLRGYWWIISAEIYFANLRASPTTLSVQNFASWSTDFLNQLAIAGWLLLAIGIKRFVPDSKSLIWLLLTAAIVAIFSYTYQPSDSVLHLTLTLLLLSPIFAAGLTKAGHWSILLPIVLLLLNIGKQDLDQGARVRSMVEDLYAELPSEALILTPGDQSIFTLWYFTHVEKQRTDLLLVDVNLFAFDWYREQLSRRYPTLEALEKDDLKLFQTQNVVERPVCNVSLQSPSNYICFTELDSLAIAE